VKNVALTETVLSSVDATVIVTDHSEYDYENIVSIPRW